jgi:hypothetical protein
MLAGILILYITAVFGFQFTLLKQQMLDDEIEGFGANRDARQARVSLLM